MRGGRQCKTMLAATALILGICGMSWAQDSGVPGRGLLSRQPPIQRCLAARRICLHDVWIPRPALGTVTKLTRSEALACSQPVTAFDAP
jgi:hypothetical protein